MRGANFRRLLWGVVVLTTLGVPTQPAAALVEADVAAWPDDAVPGRVVVATDDALAADALVAGPPAGTVAVEVADRVVALDGPVGAETATAATLHDVAGVRTVDPDWVVTTHAVPNDLRFAEQWAHQRTEAPVAWTERTDATPARIAIVDTGIHAGHPDLVGQVSEQVDLSTGTLAGAPRTGVDNDTCARGHGTQVAGVAAATGDNARDVTGVAWRADLLDISVASTSQDAECHSISMSRIVAGIDYAVSGTARPASVISISMGGFTQRCPSAMQTAVDQAWAAGAIVVASAGNGEGDEDTAGRLSFPASCDKVISVAATGPTDQRAPYSQRNAAVDVAAPGGDADFPNGRILTTHRDFPESSTAWLQGTSFAAPYVAGALALVRAERPDLSPASVVGVLLSTAKDLGANGKDVDHGHGLVQPAAMLSAAARLPAEQGSGSEDSGADDSGSGVGGGSGGVIGGDPEPDPSPEPSPEPEPTTGPEVQRVSSGAGRTEAVAQAVAVSRLAFPRGDARHAVLAREDDYADALAGSALGMGAGPLLFAPPTGGLPEETRTELARVLPEGATVYLLGGAGALSTEVERDLATMGLTPVRLSGPTREETAAVVAREVVRRGEALGRPWSGRVLLATRGDWPDAVSGGGIAALLPAPVLLTPPDMLHPATAQALRDLAPSRVLVVGGTRAVGEAVAAQAGGVSDARVTRLAGPARDATAVAIAREAHRLLRARDLVPRYAVAVNLRRADAFAHALSASVLTGTHGAVLVPVEAEDGSRLPDVAKEWAAQDLADPVTDVLLAGEGDILDDVVGRELRELLARARAEQGS